MIETFWIMSVQASVLIGAVCILYGNAQKLENPIYHEYPQKNLQNL